MCTINQMKDLVRYSTEFAMWREEYNKEANKRSSVYSHADARNYLEYAGDYAWSMILVCVLADVDYNVVCPEAVAFVKDYKIESKYPTLKGVVA